VLGRSFPIEIKCVPAASRESLDSLPSSNIAAPYVSDVIEMGMEIHAVEADGAVLA
jgi:ATP-dependent RNA helicase DHX8/PRP22